MEFWKRGCVLAGAAAISLILIASCSPAIGDLTQESGINLYIGPDTVSRLLTVDEYEVKSLDIAIMAGDEAVCEFSWVPNGEWDRKFIPMFSGGYFDIVVTHNGEKDGEFFSVTESARFRYDLGWITVIRIIPGMVGVIDVEPMDPPVPPDPIDVTGLWELYFDLGAGEEGPEMFYLEQTGEVVHCSYLGECGDVDGTTLTMKVDFTDDGWPLMLWIFEWADGSMIGECYASDAEWNKGDYMGSMRFVPAASPALGPIHLSGTLGVDDGYGVYTDVSIDVQTPFGMGDTSYFDSSGSYGIDCLKPSTEMSLAIEFMDPFFQVPQGSGPVILNTPADFRISMRYIEFGVDLTNDFQGYDFTPVTLIVSRLDSERFTAEVIGTYPFDIHGTFDVGFIDY